MALTRVKRLRCKTCACSGATRVEALVDGNPGYCEGCWQGGRAKTQEERERAIVFAALEVCDEHRKAK